MDTAEVLRKKRLLEILRQDLSYSTWEKSMLAGEADFERYADAQPEEIRNLLWRFAGSAKMLHGTLPVLACQYRRFPDEVSETK